MTFALTRPQEPQKLLIQSEVELQQHVRLLRAYAQVLKKPQRRVFCSTARNRVAIAGRRSGKTRGLGLNELLYRAQRKRRQVLRYFAPTYRMAKDLMWAPLLSAIPPYHLLHKDESNLQVTLANTGSTISLHGTEEYHNLRGPGLDFALFDEFADMERAVWVEVVRPSLADRQGDALFVGTPRGYNWAYDLYMEAQRADSKHWAAFQWTTAEAETVAPKEIELAKLDMDPRIFRQEFEASFEALSGRVYSSFDRRVAPLGNLDPEVEDDWGLDLLFGIDFNVNPMSVVVSQKHGPYCHVLDSVEIQSSNTEEMCVELNKRFHRLPPERHKRGFGPREFIAFPDASGGSRRTSAPVGDTDLTILQRHGFKLRGPDANPPVVDRVNAVNTLLCNAKGERHCLIHPRAIALTRTLDGLTYKEGTSLVDKRHGLDHMPDALGYMVWEAFNQLHSQRFRTFDVGL